MYKYILVSILMCLTACSSIGTKSVRVVNFNNVHRIGPDTKARLYFFDEKKDGWVLSDESFLIPEGQYLLPSPIIENTK